MPLPFSLLLWCVIDGIGDANAAAAAMTANTEKAVLSDLYLKRAAMEYQNPSGSKLTCGTHHHRYDPRPSRSADGTAAAADERLYSAHV